MTADISFLVEILLQCV